MKVLAPHSAPVYKTAHPWALALLVTDDRSSIRKVFAARAGGLASLIALGAWLGFLLGFAGRWAWPFDLLANFRLQYAVLLALSALTLVLLRRPRMAGFACGGALLTTVSIIGYTGWHSQPAQAASGEFRFVTFNVFYANEDLARIGEYLEAIDADVVALQEMNAMQARQLATHLPSYPHAYLGAAHRYGAVVFSRWPIEKGEMLELIPGGARVARVVIDWRSGPVTVLGTHLHWPMSPASARQRNAELEQLAKLALHIRGPVLVGGDFNITAWSPYFRSAVEDSGLQDCARGRGLIATWPTLLPSLGIRIDHCLASRDWNVVGVRTGPALGSDHYPAVNDLELKRRAG